MDELKKFTVNVEYHTDKQKQLHREDGPALIVGHIQEWYYHGAHVKCKNLEEFQRMVKLIVLW